MTIRASLQASGHASGGGTSDLSCPTGPTGAMGATCAHGPLPSGISSGCTGAGVGVGRQSNSDSVPSTRRP
jgi:hypothetical protein